MLEEVRIIEAKLNALGWSISAVGSNHGMTITASKGYHNVTVHCCTCLAAWKALEIEVNKILN